MSANARFLLPHFVALFLVTTLGGAARAQTPPASAGTPSSSSGTPPASAGTPPSGSADPVSGTPDPAASSGEPVSVAPDAVAASADPVLPEPDPAPAEEEDAGPEVSVRLGQGLLVRSADGRFSMNLRGRAQLRYEGAFDELRRGADGSSTFQARRVRLLLQGTLFGEDWTYYVQLGFSNRDTEPDIRLPLRDAYMTYSGLRDLNVRFGQMKVPYGRQRVVSSSALQFPDRSIVTNEFNLDRDIGIQVFSNDLFGLGERLGYNLGVYAGDGRNRTGNDFGMLYVGRLTTTPFGAFDQFVEADIGREARPRLALSVGGALNMNSVRARSTFDQTNAIGSFDFVHAGFDVMFKQRGFSFIGELFYRDVLGARQFVDASDPLDVITVTSRTGLGYFGQAGYMLGDHVEVVARYGEMHPRLRGGETDLPRMGEIGAGLNYYFHRHDFKIQLDWYLQHEGSLANPSEREHHIRVQTQFFL